MWNTVWNVAQRKREAQRNHGWREDLADGEGTNEPGCQLGTGGAEGNVPCGKPNPPADGVVGSRATVVIGLPLDLSDVSDEGKVSLLPYTAGPVYQELSHWNFYLPLLLREEGGRYPKQQAKRERPVDNKERVFQAYSTHRIESNQALGDPTTRQRRDFSSSWLSLTICPLVCGGKTVWA